MPSFLAWKSIPCIPHAATLSYRESMKTMCRVGLRNEFCDVFLTSWWLSLNTQRNIDDRVPQLWGPKSEVISKKNTIRFHLRIARICPQSLHFQTRFGSLQPLTLKFTWCYYLVQKSNILSASCKDSEKFRLGGRSVGQHFFYRTGFNSVFFQ